MLKFIAERPYIVAIAIIVSSGVWFFSGPEEQPTPDSSQSEAGKTQVLQSVQFTQFEETLLSRELIFNGQTQAQSDILLAAELAGQIVSINAEQGQNVEKGEIIAEIDQGTLKEQLNSAIAEQKAASLEFKAQQKLTNKGLSSRTAQSQALARLSEAKATVSAVKKALSNSHIKAPHDAIIAEKIIDQGAYIEAGQSLIRLIEIDPLRVQGDVSELDIAKVSVGQTVSIRLRSGQTTTGQVKYIAPIANPNTRTFSIEAEILNSDHKIKPGLSAELSIEYQQSTAIRISPSILVLSDDGELGLRLIGEADKVIFRPIEIIQSDIQGLWVSGISTDDKIITTGQGFVHDGQTVAPVKSGKNIIPVEGNPS